MTLDFRIKKASKQAKIGKERRERMNESKRGNEEKNDKERK